VLADRLLHVRGGLVDRRYESSGGRVRLLSLVDRAGLEVHGLIVSLRHGPSSGITGGGHGRRLRRGASLLPRGGRLSRGGRAAGSRGRSAARWPGRDALAAPKRAAASAGWHAAHRV